MDALTASPIPYSYVLLFDLRRDTAIPARKSNRPSTDRTRISTVATFEQAKEILKRRSEHNEFRSEQERTIRAMMGKLNILVCGSVKVDTSAYLIRA